MWKKNLKKPQIYTLKYTYWVSKLGLFTIGWFLCYQGTYKASQDSSKTVIFLFKIDLRWAV